MIKLGITGSISSGKTSVINIIKKIGIPTFCADKAVKYIYLKDDKFKKKIFKIKPSLKKSKLLKKNIAQIIHKNKKLLKKIEKIIHPLVRRKMNKFINKNNNKKIIALDIPLLIENKMHGNMDYVLLIQCNKTIRKKRFLMTGRSIKLFNLMEKKQLQFSYKKRFADYIINNNKNIKNTKKM